VTDRAALRSEVFCEWVIERRFVDGTDAGVLASAGVQVVDDVRPYEEAKLRMLNGSHSAMACIGAVAGLPVISDCVGDRAMEPHEANLVDMQQKYADVVSRDTFLEQLDARQTP
jgi:fructuronate reductase